MRWGRSLVGVMVAIAVVGAATAGAVGPWPGLAPAVTTADGSVRFATKRLGSSTRVTVSRARDGRVLRAATVRGTFGIPAVTVTGAPGGLSANGATLVLSEPPSYDVPRTESRFAVVSTSTLRVRTFPLRGEFGFDALSPDARTLYLIQHRSQYDASYSVRAYDLRLGRLLPRAIVDKTEPDSTMRGFPVARVTGTGATWVYTLYRRADAEPFVHALNTRGRYAVCIDVPWQGSVDDIWRASLALSRDGRQLLVKMQDGRTVARIDTATLKVATT